MKGTTNTKYHRFSNSSCIEGGERTSFTSATEIHIISQHLLCFFPAFARVNVSSKKENEGKTNSTDIMRENNAPSSLGWYLPAAALYNHYNIKLLSIMTMPPSANSLYASTAFSGRGLSQCIHLFPDTLPVC